MPETNGATTPTVTQLPDPFFDDDLTEDLLDDHAPEEDDDSEFEPETFELPQTFDDFDDDFIDDDDEDEDDFAFEPGPGVEIAATADPEAAARLDRLEAAARELAAAEVTREGRKVKRKVTAATTGAGVAGFIPILLEMTDAYSLDPTVGMAVAAIASLIGAFAGGWFTPERTPALPNATAQDLLKL